MPRCLQNVLKRGRDTTPRGRDITHGKHAPIKTILRPVAGIHFEISSFCSKNCTKKIFYTLGYLCPIVNKTYKYQ